MGGEESSQEQEASKKIPADELLDKELEEVRSEGDVIRVIHKLTERTIKGYNEIGKVSTGKGYSGASGTPRPRISFIEPGPIPGASIGNVGYVTLWDRLDKESRLTYAAWYTNVKLRCLHGILGSEGVLVKKGQWNKRWKKNKKKTKFESLFEDKTLDMELEDIVGDVI